MATTSSKYIDLGLPDIDQGQDVFETADVPDEPLYSFDSDSDDSSTGHLSPSASRKLLGAHTTTTAQDGSSRRLGPAAALLDDDERVEKQRLDTAEARRLFGDAAMAAASARVLLSSSTYEIKPRRRRRAQARRRDGASEREPDDDDDEPESAIDRLRRLRSEVAELEEQVTRERAEQEREGTSATEVGPAAAAGEDAGKDETGDKGSKRRKKKQVSPDVILRHLQLLQTDLSRLRPVEYDDSHEFTGSSGAGAGSGELRTRAEASSSKLARLGLVRDGENVAVGDESQAPRPHQPARAMDQGELEHRLASLEKFIGASEAEVDERNAMPAPLVQSVARLEHLLTLLTQPRHLDGVSRRVKVLVTDLERLHETRRKLGDTRPLNVALSAGSLTVATAGGAAGPATATGGGAGEGGGGGVTPELAQKIDTLFSLVPRVDALVPVVPRVLMRLRALARVHDDAAVFRDALREAEAGCARLKRDEGDLRAVLDGVRARMDDNEGTLRGNLGELEGRINDVVARLDKLQSSAS